MQTAPSHPYQTALTHLHESSNTHSEAVSVLVSKVSDTGALQDQADTDQAMHHEHQQLCLGQVLSSAAGLVQWSSYESPEGKTTDFEE